MRRFALFLAPLLVASAVLTGCGSSSGGGSTSSTSANSKVSVTGVFGKQPAVTIPKATAGTDLHVKTLISGHGPALPSTDALLGNYVVYIWNGSKSNLAQSTYDKVPALFAGHLLPGLTSALKNAKAGSRVLAVIPPKYGYGPQGNTQGGVSPKDTLVFVIDVIKGFAKNAAVSGNSVSAGHGLPTVSSSNPPKITIPKSGQPPKSLVSKTLINGSGATVTKGEYVIAQYVGVIWRTGKVFDASEVDGAPFGFEIGATPSQVIPGWNDGLIGKKVGSRVMLVIPPKDGYGSQGSSQAGIKGTDTLVFVIDLLAAYAPHAAA